MKTIPPIPQSRPAERGVALILTLAILALVTLMVIAFAVNMRTEAMSARNFSNVAQAQQLALGAIDAAVGELRQAVADPILRPYRSSPGRTSSTNLYSTMANTGSFNLNALGNNLICDAATFAEWINIGTNGQVASGGNPLYGRYAWFIDDEASKININTAHWPGTNGFGSDPSYVTVAPLLAPIIRTNYCLLTNAVNYIYEYSTDYGFVTPLEWIVAVPLNTFTNIQDSAFGPFGGITLDAGRLTVWDSGEQTLTPWGANRVNLNNTNTTVMGIISDMLQNPALASWFSTGPPATGVTFTNKYPNTAQIAANILDFIDTNNIPTDSATNYSVTTAPAYLGLELTPYLNELVISNYLYWSNSVVAGVTNYVYTNITTIAVELWNPYPVPFGPVDAEIHLQGLPRFRLGGVWTINPTFVTIPLNTLTIPASSFVSTNHAFHNGTNVTVRFPNFQPLAHSVTGILRTVHGRIDYAALPSATDGPVVNLGLGPATLRRIASSECRAPLLKPVSTNWTTTSWISWASSSSDSLGADNPNRIAFTDGVNDGDLTSITNISSRNRGYLESVGELGYIHVGTVPWRTLRLQPWSSTGESLPPDWAVLDLFTTINPADRVRGRVNLNVGITHAGGTTPNFSRQDILQSVAFAYTNEVAGSPIYRQVGNNLGAQVWQDATQPWRTGTNWTPRLYNWIGEICEINTTPPGATNDVNKEAWARAIANLVTTRSTAFKITAVAQTIKKVGTTNLDQFIPGDDDFVTGQVAAQAVVERGADGRFRIRYFRFLGGRPVAE